MARKFIKSAIRRPGALRARFGIKKGSTIPKSLLLSEQSKLRGKAKRPAGLTDSQTRLLRQVNLALTLRKF